MPISQTGDMVTPVMRLAIEFRSIKIFNAAVKSLPECGSLQRDTPVLAGTEIGRWVDAEDGRGNINRWLQSEEQTGKITCSKLTR